jgi:DnaJ-class molecular chaperone
MSQRDYYQILRLDKNAGPKQIKDAYRELAFRYHPDRNKENPQASEEMKYINEAYAVLSDPAKKRDYDRLQQQYGSSAHSRFRNNYTTQDIFSGSDINHIFEEMSKAFGFRSFDDIFKEFYGKEYRTFQFRRPGFFAAGFVFSGSSGKDERQSPSLPLPDKFKKLSRFLLKTIGGVELQENGSNIEDVIHLTPEQASQGGPFAYYFRQRSKKLVVKIPPAIREGQRIRLAGLGEQGKGGGRPGDLYLKVKIKQPLMQKIKGMIDDLRK